MKHFFTVFILLMFFIISTSFAQLPWTKDASNPIMSGGAAGTWNRHVSSPMVLYNPDSLRYEMWFQASDGPPIWEPYLIGFATSYDGISWTKLDTAVLKPDPGTWDETLVVWPMVIRENGTYKMWYSGWQGNNPGAIGYATSPDGVNWTKYPSNPVITAGTAVWEEGGPEGCSVMAVPGGGYKMWYSAWDINFLKPEIGCATSPDGITWVKADSVNPVLTTGSLGCWDDNAVWVPCVLFINNTYHMWYTGRQAQDNPRQTGWATSADGIHWTKYNDPSTTSTLYFESDPVLKPSSGQWDGNYAQVKTVMLEGDSLRMWYHGSRSPGSTYLARIGHATAPFNTIYVPNDYPTIQAAINAATDGDVVLVADSTYQENINFKGKAITVANHYYFDGDTSHISNTIIDGSNPSHPDSGSVVLFVSGEDTNSVLCGFTITNGTGTVSSYSGSDVRSGGGIFCCNSGASILNNKITNNSCISSSGEAAGGGVNLWSDSMLTQVPFVIVKDNQVSYNLADGVATGINLASFGGGLSIATTNALVYNNKITNNEINGPLNINTHGAGLCLTGVTDITVVDGNLISQNTGLQGRSDGGGISVSYCTEPVFINNKIINNNATWGGGFSIGFSNANIENNLIINNSASFNCGGILLGTIVMWTLSTAP